MGLVLVDITFRVEKAFQIKVPDTWAADLGLDWDQSDITIGAYHEYIRELCQSQDREWPADSWDRLVDAIAVAKGLKVDEVTPELFLCRDIAPHG